MDRSDLDKNSVSGGTPIVKRFLDKDTGKYIVILMNRYIIKEEEKDIGSGGTSIVKRAFDKDTGKYVALKMIPQKRMSQKEFKNEINILSHLSNTCKDYLLCYIDSFRTYYGGKYYYVIVTEDLSNYKELFDIISTDAYEDMEEFYQKVMTNIIKGFQILESKKVVHRDIKPENILVDEEGNIKFIDYGGACMKDLCKDGKGSHTMGYIPPEYYGRWSREVYIIDDISESVYMLSNGDTYSRSDLLSVDKKRDLEIGDKVFIQYNSKSYDPSTADIWGLGCTLWTIINGNTRPNLVFGDYLTEENIHYYFNTYPFMPSLKETDTPIEARRKKRAMILDKKASEEVSKIVIPIKYEIKVEEMPIDLLLKQLRGKEIPLVERYKNGYLQVDLKSMFEEDPSKRKLGYIKRDEDTL